MSIYKVDEEGVEALNKVSSQVLEAGDELMNLTNGLEDAASDNPEGLGPHVASLQNALVEIRSAISNAKNPTDEVSRALSELAKKYGDIIDDDPFGDAGGTALSSGMSRPKQAVHRDYISDYSSQVEAVQNDVFFGSGNSVSKEEAKSMLNSVHSFTGCGSKRIRTAYLNPGLDSKADAQLKALDKYLQSAPKWDGTVYRGITVTSDEAESILSRESIDMLGPSSWSSDQTVAERFSKPLNNTTGKDTSIVFVLKDNKSGASITHIGSWNGSESEVTAPSGVLYNNDGYRKITKNGIDFYYVDLYE